MKQIFLIWLLLVGMAASVFGSEVLYSGVLSGAGSPLRGSWEIIERDDGKRVLVLGKDFSARSGPDLKIFFSTLPLRRIHDRNAGNRSHAVRIGRLKSARGAQEYVLPNSLDLSEYRTWLVHCEAYAHFWDGAEFWDDVEGKDNLENDDDDRGYIEL